MVRAGEGALAEVALERPVSRVFPEVTGQLIRPGKLPATAFPVTVVGLFTCVCPHVGLEVGALGVRFATTRELAAVRRGALPGPRPAASLRLDAARLVVRVKLEQRRRRRRGEHHALHGRRMVLLVNAHRLPVHAVLSLKGRHALVRVLRLVVCVHVLVLDVMLVWMRGHLRHMTARVAPGSGVLHVVRAEPR